MVCSHYMQNYIEGIEKVQKRATKLTANNSGLAYIDRLKKLNSPTLVYRRHRGIINCKKLISFQKGNVV
jgi:hypothetical protein